MEKHLVDGMQLANYKDGAVIALLSIVMVFVVLIVIIVLTELISKFAGRSEETKNEDVYQTVSSGVSTPLNINDEDALVACLVASIDYRNETKKNVQVLSVKEG